MKKTFVLMVLVCVGCSEYKAIMSERIINKENVKTYFRDKENDIIEVSIDGVSHNLIFDTGAGATLIQNPKFKLDESKVIRDRYVYGFDKKTKVRSFTYSTDSVSAGLFNIEKNYLYVSKVKNDVCSLDLPFDGILGNFHESDLLLEINYEKGYLQFISENHEPGYIPLDAKFNDYNGKFLVNLTVNGTSDYFLFDTGNKAMNMLNKDVFTNLGQKKYDISFIANGAGNTTSQINLEVYSSKIHISDDLEFNYSAAIDRTSERSILSKNFIKKFNWIIDKKNNRVFCKPINPKQLLELRGDKEKVNRMNTSVIDGKLLVSYQNFSGNYSVGDEIKVVNQTIVTPSNLCEMKQLLNSTPDWDTLKLEISSPNK